MPAEPAQAGPKIALQPYGGWERNVVLSNPDLELVITLDVGPRVIRCGRPGGPNIFGELPGDRGGRGESTWKLRGGHRFWTSPEDPIRTYLLDNGPVEHEPIPGGVRVTVPQDPIFGLEKILEVTMPGAGASARVAHRLVNRGRAPERVAIWALTVMSRGSVALVPLAPSGQHPAGLEGKTAADFAPSTTMALWPYFSFSDPRWTFGSRYLQLRHDGALSSTKLGLWLARGWVACLDHGELFVKRFPARPGVSYPDGGCNFETYTDPDILELETLSPLVTLEPGQEIVHEERWELHRTDLRGGAAAAFSEHALDEALRALL
jgi:hypothetical protein